jgi:hypothetical protein
MPRWGIWTIAVVSVVVVVFAASTFFTSATVQISPKQESKDIQAQIQSTIESRAGIALETIDISHTVKETVSTTETATKPQHATGTITVYNEHSSDSLNLVERTRYKSEDTGHVYRAPQPATIPDTDGEKPGTKSVMVRAVEPGNEYNVPQGTMFRLPGLEGTSQYDSVYAKAITAITGGARESEPVLSSQKRREISETLQNKAQEQVRLRLRDEVPSDYVTYPSLINVSVGSIEYGSSTDDRTQVRVTAEAYAYMIPRDELTRAVVEQVFPNDDSPERIRIVNLTKLTFEPAHKVSRGRERIEGIVSGSAQFIWEVDESAIKKEISGTGKQQIGAALGHFVSVERAMAKVRPFWLSTFPNDPKRISIVIATSTAESRDTQASE